MPQLNFTSSVAAGASYTPLTGWPYEYLPFPAHVRIMLDAAAVGTLARIVSGTEAIVEECPITAGGSAGVFRGELNIVPIDFNAAAGDKLAIQCRNPTGGAVVLNGVIIVTPIA